MSKYTVEFYDGEVDERMPEWNVVRWDVIDETGRIGSKVYTSYSMTKGEEECIDCMNYLLDMEAGYLA